MASKFWTEHESNSYIVAAPNPLSPHYAHVYSNQDYCKTLCSCPAIFSTLWYQTCYRTPIDKVNDNYKHVGNSVI